MKKLVVGLVVVLGIGLGGLAFAHYGGHGYYGGQGYYGGHMMGPGYGYGAHMMGPGYGGCWEDPQASNVSPEQAKKLEQLRQKNWEETKGLREELFSKQQELRTLYAQPNPDQKAIDKLQKETFDLTQRLREKNFAFHQEASKIAPEFHGRYGYGKGRYYADPEWGRGCW
jgi:Spy/CpxP family protein refolding chaperone